MRLILRLNNATHLSFTINEIKSATNRIDQPNDLLLNADNYVMYLLFKVRQGERPETQLLTHGENVHGELFDIYTINNEHYLFAQISSHNPRYLQDHLLTISNVLNNYPGTRRYDSTGDSFIKLEPSDFNYNHFIDALYYGHQRY